MIKYEDLNDMSTKDIIALGRKGRAALTKRHKYLKKVIEENPGKYSTFGFKELDKGVPMVSTKMGRVALKSNVVAIEKLLNMKTTTARGAKRHQEEQLRLIIGVPKSGRLKAQQSRDLKEAQSYVEDHPETMSNYWKAFDYYKSKVAYRYMDSHQVLEEYQAQIGKDILKTPTNNVTDFFGEINRITEELYKEEQEEDESLIRFGKQGGFAI